MGQPCRGALILSLLLLWITAAVPVSQAGPSQLIPIGTGVCNVTQNGGGYNNATAMTLLDALGNLNQHLCGLDQISPIPLDGDVHITLQTIQESANASIVSPANQPGEFQARLTLTPIVDPLLQTPAPVLPKPWNAMITIEGHLNNQVTADCFVIHNPFQLRSLRLAAAFREMDLDTDLPSLSAQGCGFPHQAFIVLQPDWRFALPSENPPPPHRLDTTLINPYRRHQINQNGAISYQYPKFERVLYVPHLTHLAPTPVEANLTALVLDLAEAAGANAQPPVGLWLPRSNTTTVHVSRFITYYDPNQPHVPIQYYDYDGTPAASPVPTPTAVTLLRQGDHMILQGTITPGVARIEAYRLPRQSATQEIWEKYRQATALNWSQMQQDKVFLEWKNPTPVYGGPFAIGDLPIYTMKDFSACEWHNCKSASDPNACAFGRGYAVIAYDLQDRPSSLVVTNSDGGSDDDFKTIRLACKQVDQKNNPPALTDAQCNGNEHVEDNFCVPLSCVVGQIITNHACQPCPANQTAQGNACVMKTCPAGKQLNASGACVAITCGTGEILSAGSCVCDAAHGYSKEWGSGSCVKDDDDDGDDDNDEDKDDDTDDEDDDDTDDTDDDFTCGPGMVLFGVYGCIPQAPCPSGTVRNSPYGACVPTGGFGQTGLLPTNSFISPQPGIKNSSGGCSLIVQ